MRLLIGLELRACVRACVRARMHALLGRRRAGLFCQLLCSVGWRTSVGGCVPQLDHVNL